MSLDTSHGYGGSDTRPEHRPPTTWKRLDRTRTTTTAWSTQRNVLAEVYNFVESNRIDDALDLLYEVIDELCSTGSFTQCDRMLESLQFDRVGTEVLIGALSITLAARAGLTRRDAFVARVEAHLARSCTRPEVDDLLRGLR